MIGLKVENKEEREKRKKQKQLVCGSKSSRWFREQERERCVWDNCQPGEVESGICGWEENEARDEITWISLVSRCVLLASAVCEGLCSRPSHLGAGGDWMGSGGLAVVCGIPVRLAG